MKRSEQVGYCGSFMPSSLFESIESRVPLGMHKHVFYKSLFDDFVRAWNSGSVARVYLGAPPSLSKQFTFYIDKSTISHLKAVAVLDGVSLSSVIRSALAWSIYSPESGHDKWGSDQVLGPRNLES